MRGQNNQAQVNPIYGTRQKPQGPLKRSPLQYIDGPYYKLHMDWSDDPTPSVEGSLDLGSMTIGFHESEEEGQTDGWLCLAAHPTKPATPLEAKEESGFRIPIHRVPEVHGGLKAVCKGATLLNRGRSNQSVLQAQTWKKTNRLGAAGNTNISAGQEKLVFKISEEDDGWAIRAIATDSFRMDSDKDQDILLSTDQAKELISVMDELLDDIPEPESDDKASNKPQP
jgi:hypothetical protein